MPQESIEFLKGENLTKVYSHKIALDHVRFEVEQGMKVGLVGPRGSGKTTLLKIIFGWCRPTTGRIVFEGRPPSRFSKSRIAYLPETDYFYDWMTVGQMINLVSSFYPDWKKGREEKLIELLKLDKKIRIRKLTRDHKARLKLCLTLSRSSSLVLLDEPFEVIDRDSQMKILASITNEISLENQTLILSTPDVLGNDSLFDRIMTLDQGRLITGR